MDPIGVCPHVQPFDPGGQSIAVQSAGVVHDFGPIIMPPSMGGIPPSSGGGGLLAFGVPR
jgi:hypothetical protein